MTCDPRALGQILLETTSLSEESLQNALKIQQERGGRIGEILINQKLVTEEEVFQALSRQLNIPFWPEIADEGLDLEMLRTVPINFCKRHTLLPLKSEGEIIRVAVSDPAPAQTARTGRDGQALHRTPCDQPLL
jgi:general secretion pathway protein E